MTAKFWLSCAVSCVAFLCLVACTDAQAEKLPGVFPAKALVVLDGSQPLTGSWGAGRVEASASEPASLARAITTGRGDLSIITTEAVFDEPVDFRGRFVESRLRVDDTGRLSALEIRLMTSVDDYFVFQAPIFGDPAWSPLQSGSWLTLTASFGEARRVGKPRRDSIERISYLVRDRGASDAGEPRPLTLDLGPLRALPQHPTGAVSLTFDDGYDEHFLVAAPLLEKYGFTATAYVIPEQIGLEGYMTLDELRVLHRTYGWELGAHHLRPLTEMDEATLRAELDGVQRYLADRDLTAGGRHLAYPFGKQEPLRVLPAVRRSFQTARLAAAGPETLPPGDPHLLRAFEVRSTTTTEEIEAAVAQAALHGEWLILMFHHLVDEPDIDTAYPTPQFERVLDLLAAADLPVRSVGQVFRELALPAARASE